MKTKREIARRLRAEYAACREDPSLLDNDYVSGYKQALEWALDILEN